MMGNSIGFGVGIPGLGMLLVWGSIIWLVVWLVRSFSTDRAAKEESARQILDECFAKGKIDRQEYEQKKQALE